MVWWDKAGRSYIILHTMYDGEDNILCWESKKQNRIESNWTYRIADHPPPITLFCHLLSPLNRFSSCWSFDSNSSWIICAFSSKDCAHEKSFVSQNGFAVKPSICSSEGSWYSPAGWGNSISPRALFDWCVLGM